MSRAVRRQTLIDIEILKLTLFDSLSSKTMPHFYSPSALRRQATTQNFATVLSEIVGAKSPPLQKTFDIFLSYRSDDIDVVLGIYIDLVRLGYDVYLDRIMDPQLDRGKVTKDTADVLRHRLIQSKVLFYACTENAGGSRWMPWELGFADGYRCKAAIVPVTESAEFPGTEFLSIYPKVKRNESPNHGGLWIYEPDGKTLIGRFEKWRDKLPVRKCGIPQCPLPATDRLSRLIELNANIDLILQNARLSSFRVASANSMKRPSRAATR